MMLQSISPFRPAYLRLPRAPHPRAVVLGVCLAALLAVPAESQVVRGQVVDDQSGAAISVVDVSILDADGNVLRTTTSDAEGAFMIGTRAPGEYQLQAQRLGFETVTTEALELHRDSIVEVVIRMSSEAIALDPLEVIGRGESDLNRATFEGLYQRRARAPSVGINRVWTKDDAKLDQSMTVQQFLELYAGGIGRTGPAPARGERATLRHGCRPVYMVRATQPPLYQIRDLLELRVYELEGIEVYRRKTDAPQDLRPPGRVDCGLVIIWPRQRGDEPW